MIIFVICNIPHRGIFASLVLLCCISLVLCDKPFELPVIRHSLKEEGRDEQRHSDRVLSESSCLNPEDAVAGADQWQCEQSHFKLCYSFT